MLFLLSCEDQLRCLVEFSSLQLRFLKKTRQLTLNQEGKNQHGCHLISMTGKRHSSCSLRCINKYREKERKNNHVGWFCLYLHSSLTTPSTSLGMDGGASCRAAVGSHKELSHTDLCGTRQPFDNPFAREHSPSLRPSILPSLSPFSPQGPPAVLEQPITGHLHALSEGPSPSGPPRSKCFLKEGKIKEQGFTPLSPR